MDGDFSGAALRSVRTRFLEGYSVPGGVVPAVIQRSWQRSAALGVGRSSASASSGPSPSPVMASDCGDLPTLLARNAGLVRQSRPELAMLRGEAAAAGAILVLSDAAGMVLAAEGDSDFARAAARLRLRPGANWSEAAVGTNAVGTALAERRPVAVRGAEHFLDRNGALSCAAAPIHGPDGTLLGALDMTGAAAAAHPHTLALVRLAVAQIEHRMFSDLPPEQTVLRLHRDPDLLGTVWEGILVFADETLVAGNRTGLELLGLDAEAFGRRRARELFADPLPAPGKAGGLRRHDGTRILGRRDEARAPLVAVTPPPAKPGVARAAAGTVGPGEPAPIFDPAARARLAAAIRLLAGGVPVLIQGETGAGKDLFARAVHAGGARAGAPFVAVNCAALPESLIEGELFGHVPGAFTGARRQGAKGLLRAADGGVLFLDEIGDMPLAMQARLLRVLQDRAVIPLGSTVAEPVDFALICATHRDLEAAVAAGQFRADLYFRLAQYTVHLAPLRDFPDRAGVLAALWTQLGGPTAGVALPPDCLAALAAYDWPGNFRQAVGTLRALLALAEPGRGLHLDDLPATVRRAASPRASSFVPASPVPAPPVRVDSATRLGEIELAAMRATLEACGGNVSHAAKRLGISRSTLYRRLFGAG